MAAEDAVAGWLFIAPSLVIFVLFIFGPILYVAWLSFRAWEVVTPEKTWIGLENYRTLFASRDFQESFRNTVCTHPDVHRLDPGRSGQPQNPR
jgi:ABC-type sugar transport system permease subunit